MLELIPYRGIGPLRGLRRQMDDLWGRLLDEPLAPSTAGEGSFVPSVDMRETESAIEITAEVPGLKPEEIDVSLTGDLLTLKGEKKEEKEQKGENYHLVERRFGSFSRSFRLPVEVDPKKIQAKHTDGVLKLVLPKGSKSTTTKIKIEKG